ncbi:MAG: hypothetical protein IJT73_00675 [Selenomonadaceae bacterium]|nr:hypothetical protein [Selenomonadaceae bacterium]
MKLSTNLNSAQFIDFVKSVDEKHFISATATCGEFKAILEDYKNSQAADDAPTINSENFLVQGVIVNIVSDSYPLLLDILTPSNNNFAVSVCEPLNNVLENELHIGDKVKVECELTPYNTRYFALKLLRLKLLTAEGKWVEWAT